MSSGLKVVGGPAAVVRLARAISALMAAASAGTNTIPAAHLVGKARAVGNDSTGFGIHDDVDVAQELQEVCGGLRLHARIASDREGPVVAQVR